MPNTKSLDQQNSSSCTEWSLSRDWEQEVSPTSPSHDILNPHQMAVLEQLIENSIVPRLLIGSRTAFARSTAETQASTPVTLEHVGELAELVIRQDAAASIAYFEGFQIGWDVCGSAVSRSLGARRAPPGRTLGRRHQRLYGCDTGRWPPAADRQAV